MKILVEGNGDDLHSLQVMKTWCNRCQFSIAVMGLASCLALAACSGGESGGGGAASVATPITGTFVDSPVNGLHYTSVPSNPAGGVTANGGQYQCVPGDTVTFDLGGRVIGTGQPCGELVTAVSVFGATSIVDLRVRNLAQLLLTLGGIPADSQPIELPASIPFTLPAHLNFSDPQFEQMLQTNLPGVPLVSSAQALTHLRTSFTTLTVTAVNGGQITSIPAGLVCTAGDCSYDFVAGTAVTLAAIGTGFTGWNGDGCTGAGTCQILLTATQVVRAVFLAPPPPATLMINPNPGTGTGQVQCSTGGAFGPCAASYSTGTQLTLRGVANSGSTFVGWSNGTGNIGCTGTADCSITVTANSSVTATFTLTVTNFSVTATVATTNGGGGTVQCSVNGGEPGACGSAPVGSTIAMTAAPNAVSNFAGWTGAGCTGTGTCIFTLTANTAVTAHFNRPVLTVTVVGTGTVSSSSVGITNCTTSCTASFNRGTAITLTATGSGFSGWSGGGCSGTGTCQVTLLTDSSVTASFGGTVSSSPWYEFASDQGGGPLLVINPATPTTAPTTLVATQREAAKVSAATYANNLITNITSPALVYISAGRIWKVNANRLSNDLPGTGTNMPIQISSESAADNACLGRLIAVPEVTNINNTRIVYELPGSDNNCDTRADNVTKLVRVGDNSTVAPISLQPGRVWGREGGNLGVFNLTNGSISHIFFVDLANANTLLIMSLATNAITTIQANVGFSRIVAQDTSDRIFLMSGNTTLYLYTISTNTLTTLVSATAGSFLRRGQDFTADSTHLYLVDANPGVVKKVPLTATGSGNVIDHYTAPAPVLGMNVTENRLVLRVSSNPCSQISPGSEGLVSVRKDNNTVVSTLIPVAANTCINGVRSSGSNIFYDKGVNGTQTAGILSEDGTAIVSPISNGKWVGEARFINFNARSGVNVNGRMLLLTSPTSSSINGGTLSVYDTATPAGQPPVAGTIPSTTSPLSIAIFHGMTSTAMGFGLSQSTPNTEIFFVDTDVPNSLVRVPVSSEAQWFPVSD